MRIVINRSKLKEELIRDEGICLVPYKDTVGLWTIGVGHLLGAEERMTKITQSEAMALLESDINVAEDIVSRLFLEMKNYPGQETRIRALVNMAFNLGNRLAGFKKFIAAVNQEAWSKAGIEMMDSKWATQVGPRATRLRKMIETGEV